jgi:hypothetical protein
MECAAQKNYRDGNRDGNKEEQLSKKAWKKIEA